MLTSLLLTLGLTGPAAVDRADAPKKEPAAKKELFADQEWYKTQKGKEETFVGTLEKVKGGGDVGFGRFNPYRLKMKGDTREVYIGGKPQILAEYVGKRVKLTGKRVDIEVEGSKHREIWPARVELVPEKKSTRFEFRRVPADPAVAETLKKTAPLQFTLADETKKKELKIQARGFWRAPARPGTAAQQLVLRSGDDAAQAYRLKPGGASPAQATRMLAQALKVKTIDWDKQMVVVVTAGAKPTGGYSVEVLGLGVKDDTLTVRWKLNSPGKDSIVTQAFTHPGQAVLAERFAGKVVFDPPAKKGGKEEK